jgi:hypothetical protein
MKLRIKLPKHFFSISGWYGFVFIFLAAPAIAQEGELPEEQILIQKERKIVLPEMQKPQEKVINTLKPLPKVTQAYNYREFGLSLPLIDPKIQSPVFNPGMESLVNQGFLRVGFGNYGSTSIDGWYNSGRKKDFAYGVNLHHLASANGPVSNSGFSNNAINLNGMYFTPGFTLDGNLRYRRDRYNFFGYNQERYTTRPADSTRQLFNNLWFQLNLQSKAKDKEKLVWRGGLGLGNLADAYKAAETEVLLDAEGRYRLSDSSSITLFTDFSLMKRSDSSAQNRALWRLHPSYHFAIDNFRMDAGFLMALRSEPELQKNGNFSAGSGFHLFPKLKLEYDILDEKLKVFAGVSGGVNRKSLRSHLEVNPFLMPDVYLRHENQLLDLQLGLKGSWNGVFYYSSRFSYEKLNQQAFYANSDSIQREKFRIVYDSATTRRFTLETEAIYDPGKGSRAGVRFSYFGYQLNSLKAAWHLPRTQLLVFGALPLAENLGLSTEFFLLGGIRALNPVSSSTEILSPIADLNIKGEYRIKKRYSAFLSAQNILNNKNPRYLFYPNQGFRILIGGSVIF